MLSMVCPAVREAGIPPWGWEASENRTEGLWGQFDLGKAHQRTVTHFLSQPVLQDSPRDQPIVCVVGYLVLLGIYKHTCYSLPCESWIRPALFFFKTYRFFLHHISCAGWLQLRAPF
jgi:hypothetical protein